MIIGQFYIHLFALELFILEAEECDVVMLLNSIKLIWIVLFPSGY